jgi:hypothetical protein
VLHLSALSDDPLGSINPELTLDINYKGGACRPVGESDWSKRFCVFLFMQYLRRGKSGHKD